MNDSVATEVANPSKKTKDKDNNFNIFKFLNDTGQTLLNGQVLTAIGLIATKQIHISPKGKNKSRATIHAANWIKGKGKNKTIRTIVKRLDKSIRTPGKVMQAVMKIDGFVSKATRSQFLGLAKSDSFQHWLKNTITGVEKHRSGIRTSEISKMIRKRIYPIDAALNIGEETINLFGEWKKGDLDAKDLAVSSSNVVIKTGGASAGAIIGGAIGAVIFPPAGAAIGTLAGGFLGSKIGDGLAKFTETTIRDGIDEAVDNVKKSVTKQVKKGFKWVSGLFK